MRSSNIKELKELMRKDWAINGMALIGTKSHSTPLKDLHTGLGINIHSYLQALLLSCYYGNNNPEHSMINFRVPACSNSPEDIKHIRVFCRAWLL